MAGITSTAEHELSDRSLAALKGQLTIRHQ